MKKTITIEIIASLFILLFVYTAISKLTEYNSFKATLGKSPLISSIAPFLAIALPVVELIVGLLLFFQRTRLWGLYSSLALMSLFTIYIGYMIVFTPKLPCSCGGVLRQMTWPQHLLFNIFFTVLSLTAIWLVKTNSRQKQELEEPAPVIFT